MNQVLILASLVTFTALVKADIEQVPSELLVIGGNERITEVVNPSNFKAETTSLDLNVDVAVGFTINGKPTVCGGRFEGETTSKCKFFNNGAAWNETFELETPRSFSSSIQIDDNKALVIGGYYYALSGNALNTLETITSEGATLSSKTLPFTFYKGCATKINATHGIILAGFQDGTRSSKTWLIQLNTLEMSPGPDMKTKRSAFGCASSKNKVVVSGGVDYGSNKLASTELLDLSTKDLTWTPGPDLPAAVWGLSMVESANGILAIGGMDENRNILKSIHRLSCNEGNECQWEHKGNLNHGRYFFNVIPITSKTTTTTTPLDDDTLLQAHFNLLTLLGYRCFKNSETSFACEKI